MKLSCLSCHAEFKKVGMNNNKYCSRRCRNHYYDTVKFAGRHKTKEGVAYNAKWHQENRDRRRLESRVRIRQVRLVALALYGNECKCCHEAQKIFLTFDHIHGGGCEERRKSFPNAASFYRFLAKNYLPEKYRILCYNCNAAVAYYGTCPHQEAK